MLRDVVNAFAYMTILPLPFRRGEDVGAMFAFFPLAGALIGALLALIAAIEIDFLEPDLSAFLVLLAWIVFTGGRHHNELARTFDGLFTPAQSAERRLQIVRDARAESWAVIGLILVILAQWMLIQRIQDPLHFLIPPVMGRMALVIAAVGLPYLPPRRREDDIRSGLGLGAMLVAVITASIVCFPFGFFAVPTILLVPLLLVGMGYFVTTRFSTGLTTEVHGAICVLTEVFSLLTLAWIVTVVE